NAEEQKRNALSKEIGRAMATKDQARAAELMAEVAKVKEYLVVLETEKMQIELDLREYLENLPNPPADGVPDGKDETGNLPYFRAGESEQTRPAKPHFDF